MSVAESIILVSSIVTEPAPASLLNVTVRLGSNVTTGAASSTTVIVAATATDWLLDESYACIETAFPFTPILVQSYATVAESPLPSPVVSNINVKAESAVQLSEDPSFNWDAFTVIFPVASNETWMSWTEATGATLSSTVTSKVVVAWLPEVSSATKFTVFTPMSEQLKVVLLTHSSKIPQLSVDAPTLSMSRTATPSSSNCIVISFAIAFGGVSSTTVIVVLTEVLLL